MAPTVYISDMASNPSRSHQHQDTLDDFLEGDLRVRRRPHRLPRIYKDRRTRGSVWLQSPQMGLTADDLQQQATSRGEDEEANISANSISSSCIDTRSNNTEYGSEGTQDCSSPSDKHEKWSREEILEHQQQQCQRLLLLRKREGLLDITVRTVNLVRRNQQLQHRLAALQAETRAFVRSVLNNPENQAIRELTSRSKRKSRNEDENEDNSSKRLKQDSVTSTTIATAATTNSATKVEQDPAISESGNNQK